MPDAVPRTAKATEVRLRNAAHRAADDPKQLARAERVVNAAVADAKLSLEDHVRHLVNTAPPLTPEQRDRIASLLKSGAA